MRRVFAIVAACSSLAAGTTPAFAAGGGAPKPLGCVATTPSSGCSSLRAIAGQLSSLRISADGRNAYAGTFEGQAVLIFDRAADGTLSLKAGTRGCITPGAAEDTGCAQVTSITWAQGLGISPDPQSKYVYVSSAANDSILTFTRQADGSLEFLQCLTSSASPPSGCTTGARQLNAPLRIEVAPDGTVYALGGGTVTAFTPHPTTGLLTQKAGAAGCITNSTGSVSGCGTRSTLLDAVSLHVTANRLYVLAYNGGVSGNVAVFDTANTLTQTSCVGSFPSCTPSVALVNPFGMAVSADGTRAYITASGRDAIVAFQRNTTTGALTELTGGCVARVTNATCPTAAVGIRVPLGVTLSVDGKQLYVAGNGDSSLTTFDVGGDGMLTQKPLPFGCLALSLAGCRVTQYLHGALEVAASPDGRNVY